MTQLAIFDEPPGAVRHSDPVTSHAAAERISGRTERLILAVFAGRDAGLTDDELARALPDEYPPTVKSARSRLSNRGLLIDSGTTRLSSRGCSMTVWVAR